MKQNNQVSQKKVRDSNIELLRILMMIVIVAHHYIVNSGIFQMIVNTPPRQATSEFRTMFALLFGWGGKTAINVFLIITGYFMCRQEFKWRKVLFLAGEVVFYRWIIAAIFLVSGYEPFSLKEFVKTVLVVPYGFGQGFTSSFLGMYVLVPFINIFIQALDRKNLEKLLVTLLVIFTGFSTFFFNSAFEYLGWYVTMYLAGSYIRLFGAEWMRNLRTTGFLCAGFLVLSWFSVAGIRLVSLILNRNLPYYYFVADSNKILAFLTACALFLFFKNLNIGKSRIINRFAASTFGVLMIHASSDTMRKWLWRDICGNADAFGKSTFILHAAGCTLGVYFLCVLIDMGRKALTGKIISKISEGRNFRICQKI